MSLTIRPLTTFLFLARPLVILRADPPIHAPAAFGRLSRPCSARPAPRMGIMSALIREALKTAKRANAPAVEAYPVDTSRAGSTSNMFTGTASTFRRLGFKTVARREPSRPVMRHDLKRIVY
jgi:hypothetical protein